MTGRAECNALGGIGRVRTALEVGGDQRVDVDQRRGIGRLSRPVTEGHDTNDGMRVPRPDWFLLAPPDCGWPVDFSVEKGRWVLPRAVALGTFVRPKPRQPNG